MLPLPSDLMNKCKPKYYRDGPGLPVAGGASE
jgi:hypothetical protein